MENLSVSKIHKLTRTDKPLTQFINEEKQLFEAKKRDGRSAKLVNGINFETFLNKRYGKKLGVTGYESADAKKTPILDILKKTSEKLQQQDTPSNSPVSVPIQGTAKKTILGMSPIVFYSATGAILLITGILVYKMVKK